MDENDLKDKTKKTGETSGFSYGMARVGQIGFNIAIPILIAVLAGRYLDNRFFPNHYILTLIFPLFGGFFGIWYVYKAAMVEINKGISDEDKKEEENKNGKSQI